MVLSIMKEMDYVLNYDEFIFYEGAKQALKIFATNFFNHHNSNKPKRNWKRKNDGRRPDRHSYKNDL